MISLNPFKSLRRITSSNLYFPEIDGIRFLAILLVVLFHVYGYFRAKSGTYADSPDNYGLINQLLENGKRGVQLFFVLSGFILCLPFALHYLKKKEKPKLGRYYLRRVTRLEPPYIIAMVVMFAAHIAAGTYTLAFLFPSLLASLVYCHNIIFQHTPYVAVVAWSLEIEIQFYLLAPLLFKILKFPAAWRRGILVSGVLAFCLLQELYEPPFESIYSYLQYFLGGILLADLYVSKDWRSIMESKVILPLLPLLLALICYLPVHGPGNKLLFLAAVVFCYYSILSNPRMKAVFSYKFIPIIGGMCYSVYLLHYFVISAAGRFTMEFRLTDNYLPNLLMQCVLLCLIVGLVSAVFYKWVEQPFMASKWLTGKKQVKEALREDVAPNAVAGVKGEEKVL